MKYRYINKITGELTNHPIKVSLMNLLKYRIVDIHGWRFHR